ncbi:hypothetical protein BDZ45DRAFT_755240 [Acephala macrosclerotiorum]|nr:hypothetical protein BDZ45DRAFT_755240 [Acephala macrosclerotiorum]
METLKVKVQSLTNVVTQSMYVLSVGQLISLSQPPPLHPRQQPATSPHPALTHHSPPITFVAKFLQTNMGCTEWTIIVKEIKTIDRSKPSVVEMVIIHGQMVADAEVESSCYAKVAAAGKAKFAQPQPSNPRCFIFSPTISYFHLPRQTPRIHKLFSTPQGPAQPSNPHQSQCRTFRRVRYTRSVVIVFTVNAPEPFAYNEPLYHHFANALEVFHRDTYDDHFGMRTHVMDVLHRTAIIDYSEDRASSSGRDQLLDEDTNGDGCAYSTHGRDKDAP